jgi:nucleotide-binding universal stress UspA family protein
MATLFKKIGLAITFSPTGKTLLKEAKRLSELFGSKIIFIHVGERNKDKEKKLAELIINAGFTESTFVLEWAKGDVASAIIKKCKEMEIDLLIAGALEKEKFVKYFFGSVARKLMRETPCSLLIYLTPSRSLINLKRFCVSVDYTKRNKETIQMAHQFAILDKAKEFILVRDLYSPELVIKVRNASSTEEAEKIRAEWEKDEHKKMNSLVKELNLKGININLITLFSKKSFETNRYVEAIRADIFVITSPDEKPRLMDRVFLSKLEYTFKQLPCTLLISNVDNNYK